MTLAKKLITLIFTFFLIDLLISISLSELSNSSKIRFSRLYNEEINADIVFVGDSRGINSFYSPYFDDLTGLNSINLSYNGLTIPIVNALLDDYLERNKAPKIIFIETTCLKDTYNVLPNFKQYMAHSLSIKNMLKEHYPNIFYASFISKSYIFNSEYFLRTLYYLKKNDQKWINRYTIRKDYYDSIKPENNLKMVEKIDDSAMIIFKIMVTEYRKKGIVVIPVLAPILDKYRNETVIDNYISDINTNTKLDVVDLSDAVNDISMFADAVHTNEKGAHLIASKLYNLPELKNLTITSSGQ